MIASLPMYDRPELHDAHAEYWQLINLALQKRGIEAPPQLDQEAIGLDFWMRKDLVLSQTCGLPYRMHLHDKVALVGTPNFAIEGCPDGYYCSYIIARRDNNNSSNDKIGKTEDFKPWDGAKFAYNEIGSQSGFAAAWNHFVPRNIWFEHTIKTGSHLQSAKSVANGDADIASIDAMTWRLIERYEQFSSELDIVETTEPTPGLPYITSAELDCEKVLDAVREALSNLSAKHRQHLGIKNIVKIAEQDYLNVPTPIAV